MRRTKAAKETTGRARTWTNITPQQLIVKSRSSQKFKKRRSIKANLRRIQLTALPDFATRSHLFLFFTTKWSKRNHPSRRQMTK